MVVLEGAPRKSGEWYEMYGDPRKEGTDTYSEEWADEWLDWAKLPFRMVLSWDVKKTVDWIYGNKKILPVVVDALEEICAEIGRENLVLDDLNRWGGCFNYRGQRRAPDCLSTHAFGAAVDINPHRAPFGGAPDLPDVMVSAFTMRGFTWGGTFPHCDGMHFQAGSGI